jgi:hypothetical protein
MATRICDARAIYIERKVGRFWMAHRTAAMTLLTKSLILFSGGAFVLYSLIELGVTKRWKRFVIQLALVAAGWFVLAETTGFPEVRRTFGGTSSYLVLAALFAATMLGMVARYFFYLRGRFSLFKLIKPLLVTPMILLPLLGSIQAVSDLETIQTISLAFLAFQNGFFWHTIFDQASAQD